MRPTLWLDVAQWLTGERPVRYGELLGAYPGQYPGAPQSYLS